MFLWAGLLAAASARPPTAAEVRDHSCIKTHRGGCWNAGHVDGLAKPEHCQLACLLDADCEFFSYHPSRADKRCHFCKDFSEEVEFVHECRDPERGCFYGPQCCCDNYVPDYAHYLEDGIARAEELCDDADVSPETTFRAAMHLNSALRQYAGQQSVGPAFAEALPGAADRAAALIAGRCEWTACNEALGLWQNLRNLLALYDGHGNRAWADDLRRGDLFNNHHIMLADGGFLNSTSVEAIDRFYGQMPTYLMSRGVLADAPFATLSFGSAFHLVEVPGEQCRGDGSVAALAVTARTFHGLPYQVGHWREDPFAGTSEANRTAGDTCLAVVAHETAHQFDRALTPHAALLFKALKARSGASGDWPRQHFVDGKKQDVQDAARFFADNPLEAIASNVGNQYLHSSATQFRLARAADGLLPLAWHLFAVELLAGASDSLSSTYFEDGRVASVGLARSAAGRIDAMSIPGCGPFTFSYDESDVVTGYDGPSDDCAPTFHP